MTKEVKEQSLREWIAADIYAEWGYPESYAGYDFKDVPLKVEDKARSITQAKRFIAEVKRRLEKSALTDEQIQDATDYDVLCCDGCYEITENMTTAEADVHCQNCLLETIAAAQLRASMEAVNGK